jgi:uncharacterized glyoxalase superfamily protein PhnB
VVRNPPAGCPRIIPALHYADAAAAIDFLCAAFGFEERMRFPGPDGRIQHAEIELHGEVVMLGSAMEEMGTASPAALGGRSCGVCCYVDDVDAHHDRAKEAGAVILQEPAGQFYGDRTYRARDPEGHEWYFLTHVRDVAPEDLVPPGD